MACLLTAYGDSIAVCSESLSSEAEPNQLQAEEDGDVEMGDAAQGGGQPDIIDGPAQPSEKPRVTTRYMTKYERARILGTRALQIRLEHDCYSMQIYNCLTTASQGLLCLQHECACDGGSGQHNRSFGGM